MVQNIIAEVIGGVAVLIAISVGSFGFCLYKFRYLIKRKVRKARKVARRLK